MVKLLNVKIYDSPDKLVEPLSAAIANHITKTLRAKDHFDLCLTGGDTPGPLYKYLAENYRDKIPWEKIRFFWSDERYVPHNSPQSNFGLAKRTLLNHVPIEPANVFPMPTAFSDPAEASDIYQKLLESQFSSEWPRFDLNLLGLGDNCHIASLFPHTVTLGERIRWVVTSISPKEPIQRLSLTLPVLNASRLIYFMVTGTKKAEAVKNALSSDRIELEDCPARGIKPTDGELIWWLDKDAASLLNR